MEFPDACVLVFARLPVPGACKTRLVPELGEAGAARLQERLLRQVTRMLVESRLAPVQLWLDGPENHGMLDALRQTGAELYFQRGHDLGQRMLHALDLARARYTDLVLIGTDCPALDADYLRAALLALHGGADVVVGPAEDGGYVLLATRRHAPELFQGIAWGSNEVSGQTLERAAALDLHCEQLAELFDIDRPEDYRRAVDEGILEPEG